MYLHQDIMNWYFKKEVKFEIIKHLYNRELAFLTPASIIKQKKSVARYSVRTLRAHNVQSFDYLYNELHIKTKRKFFNMYYSLAKFINGLPMQTMNLQKRNNEKFITNIHKHMIAYDFLIDIDEDDHKNIKVAHESAKMIKEFFDITATPYELRFSGMGFHFIIPYEYFKPYITNPLDYEYNPFEQGENSIYFLYKRIAEMLKETFSELVDTTIYDTRRICKIPFSLAIYSDNAYICYPFRDSKDFENFKLNDYSLRNFNKEIRGQSQIIFNERGNINLLLKQLKNFENKRNSKKISKCSKNRVF